MLLYRVSIERKQLALSHKDTTELWRVILKYISPTDIPKLIRDLELIRGNVSYRNTVSELKTISKIGDT